MPLTGERMPYDLTWREEAGLDRERSTLMLPPTDRGGSGCTCHECQGIHCILPHPGHSHRDVFSAALGMDGAWPVMAILRRLADAADHLLTDHDCDAHGYEGVSISITEARKAADRLDAAIASPRELSGARFDRVDVDTALDQFAQLAARGLPVEKR